MIYLLGFIILCMAMYITAIYNAWLTYFIIGVIVSCIISRLDYKNFLKIVKSKGYTSETYLFVFLMDIVMWPSSIFFFINKKLTSK